MAVVLPALTQSRVGSHCLRAVGRREITPCWLLQRRSCLLRRSRNKYDRTGSGTGGGEAAPALSAALDGLALAEAARIVLRRPVTAVAAAVVAACGREAEVNGYSLWNCRRLPEAWPR